MPTSPDARRRWLGAGCLGVAAGMLICGQTLLEPHLGGLLFLIYWLICFGFTIAAIVIALLDLRALRHRARDMQREIIESTFGDIQCRPEGEDSEEERH